MLRVTGRRSLMIVEGFRNNRTVLFTKLLEEGFCELRLFSILGRSPERASGHMLHISALLPRVCCTRYMAG
jgi:hypothetical protein